MKVLVTLRYFLGLEVTYSSDGLILTQTKYASDIFLKAGMSDFKPSFSPAALRGSPGRSLVGSLQHITLTGPKISHSVNVVSQHMQNPTVAGFAAVKRIL